MVKRATSPNPTLALDPSLRDAVVDGRRAHLTENEYRVMETLASKPGKTFPRAAIALALETNDVRTVDSHVKNIRAKLNEDARSPRWLKTEHGVGYRLDLPNPLDGEKDNLGFTGRTFRAGRGDATLVISEEYHRVVLDGNEVHPTTSEYQVLLALIRHAGEAIDKEALSQEALDVGFDESGRTLASHIKNLRKKLRDSAADPRWIATEHGVGFRFVGEELDPVPNTGDARRDSVMGQLVDRLSTSLGNIVVWHDPDGTWSDLVSELELPDGARLIQETEGARLALLQEIYALAPDEQVVLYRRRRARIEGDDWLADVESYASQFEPEGLDDDAQADETDQRPDDVREVAGLDDADVTRIKDGLDRDWYTPQSFDDAVRTSCEKANRAEAARELKPWQLGFRSFGDCVLSNKWRTPGEYYATLVSSPLVPMSSVPEEIRSAPSFSQFVSSSIMSGTLLPYDSETWITPAGLRELDITRDDLDAFVRDAVASSVEAGIPQFTVTWLRSHAPGLVLLDYGLEDCFYESVLLSRRGLASRGHLGGRRIFAEPHAQARGRDLVESLVRSELSVDVEGLLDILRDDYGIPVQRASLVALVRKTNLFFSPELDRVYVDHNQFVREVE